MRSAWPRWSGRSGADVLVLAAVAYVPLLVTAPGWVGADTKSYLYLDPDRLLSGAAWSWQNAVGLGTVTHQNIGYLWPMGPWFWAFEHLGVPDWAAQRLWLGTVLFLAGLGVRYLLRTLGWRGGGLLVASLAYLCSPYVLHYSARISVLLLPFAGLPWLIALTERSLRSRGWRYPAAFALVVTTIGSTNATSLLLVGLGPALWIVHTAVVLRRDRWRHVLATSVRIGVLTLACSLWWIAGLANQSAYSLPVTRYTETYEVVADASSAPEVLRGLGYWFFYGQDKLGPWVDASVDYTNDIWLLALSYALPIVALVAAAVIRWRHRSFFLLLLAVGALTAVAAHPFDDPSPLGRLFREFTRTDAGLAMRSTPRAVPLVVLATAVLLGAGVGALGARRPRWATPVGLVAGVAVVANLAPLWQLGMVERNLRFPEDVPEYWNEAADHLDGGDHDTRVLEVPGSDFTSYRWGNTIDPVTPGLIDRPYAARELVPSGSGPSAALLAALDRGLQEGTFDPEALAPVARLLGVGDIVYRADLQYERYRTPRPQLTWDLLRSTPGLGAPIEFGTDEPPNVAGPEQPLIDELTLQTPADLPYPPAVAVFPVLDPEPMVRAVPADRPVVLVGDPQGVVDAAGAGLVDTGTPALFASTVLDDPDLLRRTLDSEYRIVLTDTHRRQAQRWGTIREVMGYTEPAGSEPLRYDPSDNRLPVFGDVDDVPDDRRTVAEHRGVAEVSASDYGNRVTYTPDDRAVLAVDGDPTTAWRVGAFGEPVGERLVIELDQPTGLGAITLLQAQDPGANRYITEARIRFDDGEPVDVTLDDTSRLEPGQVVRFERRPVTRIEIEIRATNVPPRPTYYGVSPVGLAEVGIGDVRVDEVIRLPQAFLDEVGADVADHPVDVVLTRLRSDPREPVRRDTELSIVRALRLGGGVSLDIAGDARLSAAAPEPTLDAIVGRSATTDGVTLTATSSTRLPGDLAALASSAFDGDPSTAWRSGFSPPPGTSIQARRSAPTEISSVTVTVANGLFTSVPTALDVLVDGVQVATIGLDDVEPSDRPDAAVTRSVSFPAVSGSEVRLVADEIAGVTTKDWYSGLPSAFPIALVDVVVDGFEFAPPTREVDTGCRDDLLTVDGEPVAVRIAGSTTDALARRPLPIEGCEPLRLDPGDHVVRGAQGRATGIDLDQLIASSDPSVRAVPEPGPAVASDQRNESSIDVTMARPDAPVWLVLGQSLNPGWHADLVGVGDLGEPTLINGYANGWLIDPSWVGTDTLQIRLRWTPQVRVWRAIVISGAAALICLLLVWRGRRSTPAAADQAVLQWPIEALAVPVPGRKALVAIGVAVALGAALNLPDAPLWAVVVALAVVVPLWRAVDVPVPAIGAAVALSVAGAFHVVQQVRHRYPADFNWPLQFERVHVIGVVAVLLVLGEVVRVLVLDRWATRRQRPREDPRDTATTRVRSER